jgi:hypothetical protein
VFVQRENRRKNLMMEDETLKAWKDFAAHNFIPKALAVGVLANLINFVILSRYVCLTFYNDEL